MLHIKWLHTDTRIYRSFKNDAVAHLYFNKLNNQNYLMIKSNLSNQSSFDAYIFKCNVSHVYRINARYTQIIKCIKKDNCIISARHTWNSKLIENDWNYKYIKHVSIDKNDSIQFVLFIVHTFSNSWNA